MTEREREIRLAFCITVAVVGSFILGVLAALGFYISTL